jgi:ubiquinone/menaquinone biosynthesis C-methylase UbiE
MAEMVSLEKFFCRSGPWRAFTGRYVLPWALQGIRPAGDALEIGAGSGLMAMSLLRRFPELRLTVTDYDSAMLDKGRVQLEAMGSRADIRVADATSLSFPDSSFDYVFSFIMLHHVIEWEKALSESIRVLRPGGWLVGYDLLDSRAFRLLHQLERAQVRLLTMSELNAALDDLRVERVVLDRSRRTLVRFRIRKS